MGGVPESDERFRPLRPASKATLTVAFIVGPILWIVALVVAAVLLDRTDAIELGLLLTVASFAVAALVLTLLWFRRRRQERSYVAGS